MSGQPHAACRLGPAVAVLSLLLVTAAPAAPDRGAALDREHGWTTLGFPLRDTGRGVMLEIRGRTEIGPVEILFDDGEMVRIGLERGRAYGRGLYEISDFGAERRVMLVRFRARARSAEARLNVLLARETPAAG